MQYPEKKVGVREESEVAGFFTVAFVKLFYLIYSKITEVKDDHMDILTFEDSGIEMLRWCRIVVGIITPNLNTIGQF